MQKFILSIIALSMLLIYGQSAEAQCTPDTTLKSTGIYPTALDTAVAGVAYSQVIQYHIAKDTLFQGFNARIDSLVIDTIMGLPAGIHYACPNNRCRTLGGETSCLLISGTASAASADTLTVMMTVYGYIFAPFNTNASVPDTNRQYVFVVKGGSGVIEQISKTRFSLYPNPARELLNIESNVTGAMHYTVFDIRGVAVKEGMLEKNSLRSIETNALSSGMYLLRIDHSSGTWSKSFIIE